MDDWCQRQSLAHASTPCNTSRSCSQANLDATHLYADARADLEAWWPKLKVGGLMAGDDYHNGWVEIARYTFGVKDAVDEFFGGGARDHRVYVTTHHDFDARPEPQMPQWYVFKCAE